jgi:serine/threonine protein kinase
LFFAHSSDFYDPLKVDMWSLGATTWELVHGDPPFSDAQDARHIVGTQLPPVQQPDAYSRPFHDFLHLCSQPAASRPDPDELLNVRYLLKIFWLIHGFIKTPPSSSPDLFCTNCVSSLRDRPTAGTVQGDRRAAASTK